MNYYSSFGERSGNIKKFLNTYTQPPGTPSPESKRIKRQVSIGAQEYPLQHGTYRNLELK